MNDPIFVRRKIREVLALAPRRRFSESMLHDHVARLLPEPLTVSELKKGILWNQSRGLMDFVFNGEEERDEWSLTDAGKVREGIV